MNMIESDFLTPFAPLIDFSEDSDDLEYLDFLCDFAIEENQDKNIKNLLTVTENKPQKKRKATANIGRRKRATKRKIDCDDDDEERSAGNAFAKLVESDKRLWWDIFAQNVILIRFDPNSMDGADNVCITDGEECFVKNFRYAASALPMPLKKLFGRGTIRTTVHQMKVSLMTETPYSSFINLYRADGVVLTCHISMTPFSPDSEQEKLAAMNQIPFSYEGENGVHLIQGSTTRDKFAYVTIYSAAVVGNAKRFGGFRPTSSVPFMAPFAADNNEFVDKPPSSDATSYSDSEDTFSLFSSSSCGSSPSINNSYGSSPCLSIRHK